MIQYIKKIERFKMKNNKKDKLTWRRLDNSAKIFPLSTGEKYSRSCAVTNNSYISSYVICR